DQSKVRADQSLVESAQRALDNARLSAQKSADQAQQQVDSAQLALTTAQRTFATKTQPSADAIKAAEQALQVAQENLAATRLKLDQSSTQSSQQVSQAALSVESAHTSYTTKTAPASDEQVASDEAQVASSQASVTSAQQALDRATLTSPIDGTVVEVNVQPRGSAPSGYAIVIQSTALDVVAEVAESDVPSLSVGQTASVTVAATGETFPATVTSISPVASTGGTTSVVSYSVDVALDDSSAARARAGMSADVSVTIQSVADVIAVPAIAVQGSSGAYALRVLDANGQVETRSVDVGLMTSSLAEIRSGLSEGDTVVVGTRSQRTGTSSTLGGGLGTVPIGGGGIPAGGVFRQGQGGQGFRP
ncbi:MAG TPA: HlyD family efflux transporter periplasmic adaptor subunit, partial [Candidatus Limnocylindrales bacterium]